MTKKFAVLPTRINWIFFSLLLFQFFFCILDQWSSRCAPVHTSVHENYFTVHRKNSKIKNIFLMILILSFSDILGIL